MRNFIEIISNNPLTTIKLGKRLGILLTAGDVIALTGELGSGKTTFTKGIASGLGIDEDRVKSPSFVLIKEYHGRIPLYHFDLYRLNDLDSIRATGYEEYLYGDGAAVIEWAERLNGLLPKEYLHAEFSIKDDGNRTLRFTPYGKRGSELIEGMRIEDTCH